VSNCHIIIIIIIIIVMHDALSCHGLVLRRVSGGVVADGVSDHLSPVASATAINCSAASCSSLVSCTRRLSDRDVLVTSARLAG